ncbi:MAG: hypothetical protein K2Z25_16165, partial [Beijerinckiaceae bacterium]|nr:hypothetical protein [Beijerinckiaceae bacterium]
IPFTARVHRRPFNQGGRVRSLRGNNSSAKLHHHQGHDPRSVEFHMNGFDFDDIEAELIASIPPEVVNRYQSRKSYKARPWPWYAHGKNFFRALGADFRTLDGVIEMLLNDVVFRCETFLPCGITKKRSIGARAIGDINNDPHLLEVSMERDTDDELGPGTGHVAIMLGLCLIRCHQIEEYICNSFLLGISKKQKAKYKTLDDLKKGWKRKTLGDMIKSTEEAWDIHEDVKIGLSLFVSMRNRIVHGISLDDEFDIRNQWGQKELVAFLYFFDIHSKIIRKAFRSSFYASIQFGIDNFKTPEKYTKNVFNKKQREEMGLFPHFFRLKEHEV